MADLRLSRQSEAFSSRTQSGSEMAFQIASIEDERCRWAGTIRQEVTSDELDERYFVREVIGSGSFGTVYRAIRAATSEEVAIKEVDTEDPNRRADAVEECVLWQEISRSYHPSILALVEILEVAAEQSLFLVTERIAFGVLSDAIFDLELSEQACRQMMIQLTSAVAHLHEVCYHPIATWLPPECLLIATSRACTRSVRRRRLLDCHRGCPRRSATSRTATSNPITCSAALLIRPSSDVSSYATLAAGASSHELLRAPLF